MQHNSRQIERIQLVVLSNKTTISQSSEVWAYSLSLAHVCEIAPGNKHSAEYCFISDGMLVGHQIKKQNILEHS